MKIFIQNILFSIGWPFFKRKRCGQHLSELASSHYAEEILYAIKERIKSFFQKNINSPNVP
jgi:hypothetical protein